MYKNRHDGKLAGRSSVVLSRYAAYGDRIVRSATHSYRRPPYSALEEKSPVVSSRNAAYDDRIESSPIPSSRETPYSALDDMPAVVSARYAAYDDRIESVSTVTDTYLRDHEMSRKASDR